MKPSCRDTFARTVRSLAFVASVCAPVASAQVTLISEDFSFPSGQTFPDNWGTIATLPTNWFVGWPDLNGCFPAWMEKAFICDDELWGNGICGASGSGYSWTEPISPPAGSDVIVSFDYYLSIDDAGGDWAKVVIFSGLVDSPSVIDVASSTSNLLQTGMWESISVRVPAASLLSFLTPPFNSFSLGFRKFGASEILTPGWVIDNLLVTTAVSLDYTEGCNGMSIPCPCGNNSTNGCWNSMGLSGRLLPEGSNSAGADDLTLDATGLVPGKLALLLRGSQASTPWSHGAGATCLDWNTISSLGARVSSGQGSAQWGGAGFFSANNIATGSTLNLQVLYRDPLGASCGGSGNNATSTISMTVLP
ncbi:MAG: hypothetical protein ACI8X5_001948 [Planctomycetota bacterium]|jgi:hypothetical protein